MGVVVSEISSEIITATDSVTANSRNMRPTCPPMNSSGMNTATSETLMVSTVKPTSRAPSSAAWRRAAPCSRWRVMFSSTTMASSTTKPVATVSAISVRLFRLKPSAYMAAKVPSSDTTVATAGISAARSVRRNRPTTAITSSTATARVISTSRTEARTEPVRSTATCSSMSLGSCSRSCGSSASMASAVSIRLAVGCWVMLTTIAGWPLNMPRVRVSCTLSMTRASCDRRTSRPSRMATIRSR